MDDREATFRSLARRSRMTAFFTFSGAILILGALVYSSFQLMEGGDQIDLKRQEVELLEKKLETETESRQRRIDRLIETLTIRDADLRAIRESLIETRYAAAKLEERLRGTKPSGIVMVPKHVAPDDSTLQKLLGLLKHEDFQTRSKAVEALGMLNDRRVVGPLIKVLEEDENEEVRIKAALTLGNLGDKRATGPLVRAMLHSSEKTNLRYYVAIALGGLGDQRAVDPLIRMVIYNKDRGMRVYAASALGDLGNRKVLLPLVRMFELERKPSILRVSAALALGDLGDRRAFFTLSKALEDKNAIVRASVALALGDLGDKRAIEPLTQALNDENENVRINAEEAIKTHIEQV